MTVTDIKQKDVPDEHHVPRQGEWLTQSHDTHQKWVKKVMDHVDKNPKDFHPTICDFQQAVHNDTRLTMLFATMFDQVPHKPQYNKDPVGQPQIRDVDHLCAILNHIITTGPAWTDVGQQMGVVGVPINAILDWPMGTRSGFAVFLDPTVNKHLKRILNAWGEFLSSPASASVLGTDQYGWFGEHGKAQLIKTANLGQTPEKAFEELFECDPQAEHHGYASWDAFFTRHFRFGEGVRPVASPDDDAVIANPCESRTYKVAHDVKARERFWVKGQPYSVVDMLAHDPLAEHFVGGTVYQAFLSALSYHRWHTPVSGVIKKAFVVDGTYYSEPLFEDFTQGKGADEHTESSSQEYLTACATRAIVFIEADNPKIGLMAFMGVGMIEVSTCDITVKEGQHVTKGEEIGMFHFGGSTQCCLFRKGVRVEGFPEPGHPFNHPVRAALGRVI